MIPNTQEGLKKIKISTEQPREKLQACSKMLYFRFVNKRTYSIFLHEDLKLVQIKGVLARLVNLKDQYIRLIYKGEELVYESQLHQIEEKAIVHVVKISKSIREDVCIWINFLGTFRKKYSVKKDSKVVQLIFHLKKAHKQLRDKDFLFINLGRIVDKSLTFQENRIQNDTQIFAIEIKNKTVNFTSRKENHLTDMPHVEIPQQQKFQLLKLKGVENQKNDVLEQKVIEAPEKQQLNQLGIAISDVFNIHKTTPKIQLARNKTDRNEIQSVKSIQFDHLLIRSNREMINLGKQDFLFAGFQHLADSQNFIKNSIQQAKLQFLKSK